MMPASKRSKPSTPSKKKGGMQSSNALPFEPAPIKYDVGGMHTRSDGVDGVSKDEKGTGKN